jgi:hypothetical protein
MEGVATDMLLAMSSESVERVGMPMVASATMIR